MVSATPPSLPNTLTIPVIRSRAGGGHEEVQVNSADVKGLEQIAFGPVERASQADWDDIHSTTRRWDW
jgi:hypothetical protein